MSIQSTFELSVADRARAAYAVICAHADELAAAYTLSADAMTSAILADLRGYDRAQVTDARTCLWRARLRLYPANDTREAIADSDAELSFDHPGATVHNSLPAVCSWITDLASAFHGSPCMGLGDNVMQSKARTLRTQMSVRKDGTGTMRIEYTSDGRRWLARCDVVRESTAV